jgi:hypothetical protein
MARMGRHTIPRSKRSWVLPTPPSTQVCTHERGPGTTVCLRCRHAERREARVRTKRLLLRGTAVAIVVGTFIAAGAVGATAIRAKVGANRAAGRVDSAASTRAEVAPVVSAVDSAPAPTNVTPRAEKPATPAQNAVANRPAPAPVTRATVAAAAPISPIIPIGRTDLPDSVTAIRTDSNVVVSFDLMMVRTRRAQKFEQFVRATLPAIYGRGARDALAKVPDGTLASQGDLITELPNKGLRIPVGTDWQIRLFPETRPGHDGPLVVRYRVSVVPGN